MAAALPRVYPILDSESLARRGISLVTCAAAFLEGGAAILQIRHKGQWDRAFFEQAKPVAGLARQAGAALIVNDRADFALLLDAGLHVGQEDLEPRDARRLLGPDAEIGYSSHGGAQLVAAAAEPVDYVAIGPIFATASKHDPDPAVGVDEVRRSRPLLALPLVAIGGITLENALDVLRAGADSVAVIAGLLPDPTTPQALRQRMEEWQRMVRAV